MEILEKYKAVIKEQIIKNYLKNIFNQSKSLLSFNGDTAKTIIDMKSLPKLSDIEKVSLVNYASGAFVDAIYNDNQYLNFTNKDIEEIKNVYYKLFDDIDNGLDIEQIEKNHYSRITDVLKLTNRMVAELNTNNEEYIRTYVCSEYSAKFQLDLFSLNLNEVQEPILDIGCGEKGYLVEYLVSKGFDAFGIDRNHKTKAHFEEINWFDYQFVENTWGTIISNLSFSNHFIKNYLNKNNVELYAKTYMAILKSLKVGGKWYYAPSLPFVEKLLSDKTYKVVTIPFHDDFSKTIITRIE